MSVVEIVDHPLIQHKISLLRDRNTGTKEFRDLVSEIAMLLCYEATRDLPTEEVEVETPVALARTKVLAGRKLALVPILRAAPYNTIRRASHYRKRPRRPGGRPPYIPLYHIPWGGPSPATHSRHPVGAGHARPAALPLYPLYLLYRREGS